MTAKRLMILHFGRKAVDFVTAWTNKMNGCVHKYLFAAAFAAHARETLFRRGECLNRDFAHNFLA